MGRSRPFGSCRRQGVLILELRIAVFTTLDDVRLGTELKRQLFWRVDIVLLHQLLLLCRTRLTG